MGRTNPKATARVQVLLEIDVGGGHWGPDCTVGQVHDQAMRDVKRKLAMIVSAMKRGVVLDDSGIKRHATIRVIGDARPLAIIYDSDAALRDIDPPDEP